MKILSKVKRVLEKASVLTLSMSLFLGLSFSQAEIGGNLGSNLGLNLGIKIEAVLNEGTQVELSQEQISEMLPWAKNSKIFLEDLLEDVAGLRKAEQLQQLKAVIRDVVLQSAPKKTELLMRYVLNRSMMLVDVISNESVSGDRGIMNNQLRLLKRSVEMALGYYKSDLSYLNGEDDSADRVSFAVFGLEYSVFLADLGNSILDASAQYKVIRMRLGFLQNSLYRDQNNKVFAPSIISLNNALKANPEEVEASDQNYLERIRQLKRIYEKQKAHIVQELKEMKYDISNFESQEVERENYRNRREIDRKKMKKKMRKKYYSCRNVERGSRFDFARYDKRDNAQKCIKKYAKFISTGDCRYSLGFTRPFLNYSIYSFIPAKVFVKDVMDTCRRYVK